MTLDEATTAYLSASKLRALYDAYRAASRAHALVLHRLAAHRETQLAPAPGSGDVQRLVDRQNLARATFVAFGIRAAQLDRRIKELQDFQAP